MRHRADETESASPLMFATSTTKDDHSTMNVSENQAADTALDEHATQVLPRRVNPVGASGSCGSVEHWPQRTPKWPWEVSHVTFVKSSLRTHVFSPTHLKKAVFSCN